MTEAEAKTIKKRAMGELAAIIEKAKADANRIGIGTREWRETIDLVDGLNRSAGWPAKRTLLFVSEPNRSATLQVPVVAQLGGGATPEITTAGAGNSGHRGRERRSPPVNRPRVGSVH